MNVSDFSFELPEHLIAQFPPANRGDSRLLKVLSNRAFEDTEFNSIIDELRSGDLLVLNNTKVIPARLYGKKDTGGKLEILLERVTGEHSFLAQIRSSKAPKIGQAIIADEDEITSMKVVGRQGMFFAVEIEQTGSLFDWFERVGHMPLPPYIERNDDQNDAERYQTVFAEQKGAVAAPTAGLHYSDALLDKIRAKGVKVETITLHVGAGTYQPVKVESVDDHEMHSEYVEVSQAVCDSINDTKANGGRVIAVGTTVVRSLESAAQAAKAQLIEPFYGDTKIFIYPGFDFKVIDLLQTNFHLSESTLLMLVSAFSGKERIRQAYQHAIAHEYRFFSYGDAMLLERA
jgi:S-adenosylmethionine:tRNA ribosyltransferase-isomerase